MNERANPGGEVRDGQRIAKVMARAGLCSRRDAEAWIAAGRVLVNGKTLDSPAYNVSKADDIWVDGKRLAAPERTRLFLFHKPRGLVTTAHDPEGRVTIFDALPPALPRLVAIGRLDINSEGLLLLTNDGGLARVLELPATGWLRRYRVRAHGAIDQTRLDRLSQGIRIDGVDYAGIEARLDREQGSNAWLTLCLREGKNREIKKVLEHLGLAVNRLIRVSFGPFELGNLAEGEVAEVRTRVLREQLGAKLAREAGADFDAPLTECVAPPAEPRGIDKRQMERSRRETAGRERTPEAKRGRGEVGRGRRPERDEAPAPSAPERRRKHVSALRAEIAAGALGPRKRVKRSATRDRKGREIAVERLASTEQEARGRVESKTRGRSGFGGRVKPRAASSEPGKRSFRSGFEAGERSRRPKPFESRLPRDRERRGEHPDRAPRSATRDFPPRRRDPGRPEGERRGKGGEGDAFRLPRASPAPRRSPSGRSPGKRPSTRPDGGPRNPPRKPS